MSSAPKLGKVSFDNYWPRVTWKPFRMGLAGCVWLTSAGRFFAARHPTEFGWPKRKRRSGASNRHLAREKLSDRDRRLFDALRELRRQLATDAGVPPYIICHDRSLVEIAERRPRTHGALHEIAGFGNKKVLNYGHAILDVVTQFE